MKPYIEFGAIKIYYYSLTYIIAFFLGIFISSKDKLAHNRGVKNKKTIEDFAFFTMIYGILGARIYYVLFNLDFYFKYST